MHRMVLVSLILSLCLMGLFSAGISQSVLADEGEAEEEAVYECRMVSSEEEAARLLWSACKAHGMSRAKMAAVLGCLSFVSSLDPGTMEYVSDDHALDDPWRIHAMEDPEHFSTEHLAAYFQAIGDDGRTSLNEEYETENDTYCVGLGLAKWKGNQGLDFLDQADFLLDGQWNTIDFNAAYLLQSACPTGSRSFGDMLCQWKTDDLSTEQAVYVFATEWLGWSQDTDLTEVTEKAMEYREAMAEWEYDEAFGQDIKLLVTRLDHHRVIQTFHYDNSTPELAAVSLSHQRQGDGFYDYGTELYKTVRDNVGDPWVIYQSCDRLIGAALRWSGADVDFPMGNVRNQYQYVTHSDQWEYIATAEGISRDNLQPGDIFICLGNVGHIWMYVGQDAIREIYGDDFWPSDADSVSAGYKQWSPMVGNYFHMHIEQDLGYVRDIDSATGTYYNPLRFVTYYQFRMVYSDDSDMYRDAADGDPLRWPR